MSASPEEPQPASRRRPFRETALTSGLVTTADVDAAEAFVRSRSVSAGQAHSDSAVAKVLVEQGKLTSFQAREVLAGRTRFRLGQYTVIDEIGRGGMGQVFKAEHALMGRHVAVKVLPRAKATPESEAAFRREMRILGRLDHENLVRAFDAGYDAMVYYLVTELVPGLDLRHQVRKYGPLDEMAAASVFTQVARALAFAHAQGLVHRDVKPGNILVMDDGRVKLLDLGLAGSTLEAEALRLGRVVGTMDYIAPEQIRTPDDVGPTADIYSLGCSMYYALTGEVPFPGGSRKDKMRRHLTETPVPIQQLAPWLAQPMCHVVEAMMAKNLADRVGSADEVVDRLSRWAPDRPAPLPRRRRREAVATAAAGGGDTVESSGTGSGGDPAWPVLDTGFGVADAPPRRRGQADTGDAWSTVEEFLGGISLAPAAAGVAGVLVPAVLAGVCFTIALSLVRAINADRFDQLLGSITPATCGWGAFLAMAAVRAVARLGRLRR